jgi:hypothetical protein
VAGETPGAANAGKRRKLPWNDDKSTNKIYASGDISALGDQTVGGPAWAGPAAAREGGPGKRGPSQNTPNQSTDKYYRAQTTAPAAGVPAKLAALPPISPRRGRPQPAAFDGLVVRSVADVAPAVQAAINAAADGGFGQVAIAAGRTDFMRRARAALDLAVTREELTEDQARDVKLGYAPPTPGSRSWSPGSPASSASRSRTSTCRS